MFLDIATAPFFPVSGADATKALRHCDECLWRRAGDLLLREVASAPKGARSTPEEAKRAPNPVSWERSSPFEYTANLSWGLVWSNFWGRALRCPTFVAVTLQGCQDHQIASSPASRAASPFAQHGACAWRAQVRLPRAPGGAAGGECGRLRHGLHREGGAKPNAGDGGSGGSNVW